MSRDRTWLELLTEDASLEALDRHREKLLDDGVDPELVESEAARAVLVHARLRERSQHAAELTALSDIAGRLASVRDLGDLLGEIAVQARQLLRTDVAYLALVDGDDLRVQFSEGTMGPAIRRINLSMTEGLAGRIVTTGRAGWTSDYLGDATIEHQAEADELATSEQLQSILGVPLRAGGTTLGVLFTAERRHRRFADTEVALLARLAGHAAVAIESSRLFAAERTSAVGLRAANDRLGANAASLDRAIVLHDRLVEAVVRGGQSADVVQALADVLGAPVQLVDSADRPLAGPELGGPSPAALITSAHRRNLILADDGLGRLLLCPVVAAEDYLGCLVVRTTVVIDDAKVRLLERGAMVIALVLVRDRAVADATTRNRGEILAALLERGDTDSDVLSRRADLAGMDLSKAHRLGVVAFHHPEGRDISIELARRCNGLFTEQAGRTVMLVPDTAELEDLAAHATVGVSAVVGAAAVPDAYATARQVLRALLALGRHHVIADASALGVYRFLLAGAGTGEAAEFVRRTVGPLHDRDAARRSDLAATLEEYLASGRQHAATAEALHIHPNTLYQRLDRIGAILGEGWRKPDEALDLLVALRLHRLAKALDD